MSIKRLVLIALLFVPLVGFTQSGDFEFGKILRSELEMKTYAADTSAAAVVLNEFGEAYFDDEVDVVFEYHVKIKILKKEGMNEGDFKIYLGKDGNVVDRTEKWVSLEASTFNLESNSIRESKFEKKDLFIENSSENYTTVKFALKDVKVGSVLEVKYVTKSPFYLNFKSWFFQGDLPKIRSEFWAKIPANFTYGIRLQGFLKLKASQVDLERQCFQMPGAGASSGYQSSLSDCSVGKYVMENVPSFKDEKFISTKKNYISAIYYELSEINQGGSKRKFSEEWKDVDLELKEHLNFGQKIKKAKKLLEDIIPPMVGGESDPLKKANMIYYYINHWYVWNEEENKYTLLDPKKSYESKKGNSADINFALIAALQVAGLNADPVILSTREHGLPFKLHPQRSDFNYVVSSLKIGDQMYLLDATDPLLPFGVLPIKCMNDQGRLVSKDESGWVDLKPAQKNKSSVSMELKPTEDGTLRGKLTIQHVGYSAYDQRKEMLGLKSREEYLNHKSKELSNAKILSYEAENLEDLNKPLIEKMEVEISGLDETGNGILYFNPFLTDRYETNPFKSNERLYPVDLGAAIESSYFISVELPEKYKVDELPSNMALSLPQNGGKCLLNVNQVGNKVTLTSILSLNKPIYTSEEYHNLKEFFARVVQMQQSQFVFKTK